MYLYVKTRDTGCGRQSVTVCHMFGIMYGSLSWVQVSNSADFVVLRLIYETKNSPIHDVQSRFSSFNKMVVKLFSRLNRVGGLGFPLPRSLTVVLRLLGTQSFLR